MILPYAREIDYDKLMDSLNSEILEYDPLPLINQLQNDSENEYPFRVLIGTVLSSRTRDEYGTGNRKTF